MFKEWEWVAAKPEPDLGADAYVELPSDTEPEPMSFLAQIRSHQKPVSRETIERASALRLRDSGLACFVFSFDAEQRRVRWVYLEPLFDKSEALRSGGNFSVRLSEDQSFPLESDSPPEDFMAVLRLAKRRGALKAAGSLANLSRAIAERYEDLDARLVVTATFDGQREVLRLAARDAPVQLKLEIVQPTQASRAAWKAAFEWGSSAVVEADEVRWQGSTLLDFLNDAMPMNRLCMRQEPVLEARGVLTIRGARGAVRAEVVEICSTRGSKGVEMSLTLAQGFMAFVVRMEPDFTSTARLRFDVPSMKHWSLRDCHRARRALAILDSLGEGAEVECAFEDAEHNTPLAFWWAAAPAAQLDTATHPARAANALLSLSEHFGFDVDGFPFAGAGIDAMDGWILAAALVAGRTVSSEPRPFSLHWSRKPALKQAGPCRMTIAMRQSVSVLVGGREMASVPLWATFDDYACELQRMSGIHPRRMRCLPRDSSLMTHHPDSDEPPLHSGKEGRR